MRPGLVRYSDLAAVRGASDASSEMYIDPMLSSPPRKDEDELEWAVQHQTYTRSEADALYAEGEGQ